MNPSESLSLISRIPSRTGKDVSYPRNCRRSKNKSKCHWGSGGRAGGHPAICPERERKNSQSEMKVVQGLRSYKGMNGRTLVMRLYTKQRLIHNHTNLYPRHAKGKLWNFLEKSFLSGKFAQCTFSIFLFLIIFYFAPNCFITAAEQKVCNLVSSMRPDSAKQIWKRTRDTEYALNEGSVYRSVQQDLERTNERT